MEFYRLIFSLTTLFSTCRYFSASFNDCFVSHLDAILQPSTYTLSTLKDSTRCFQPNMLSQYFVQSNSYIDYSSPLANLIAVNHSSSTPSLTVHFFQKNMKDLSTAVGGWSIFAITCLLNKQNLFHLFFNYNFYGY